MDEVDRSNSAVEYQGMVKSINEDLTCLDWEKNFIGIDQFLLVFSTSLEIIFERRCFEKLPGGNFNDKSEPVHI